MTRLAKGFSGELFDLDALVDESDKVKECGYFLALMERESDWNAFRYLTGALLAAAYSFFEVLALRVHYRLWNLTGEFDLTDGIRAKLSPYVNVFKEKRRGTVKTGAVHPLVVRLYDLRRKATHYAPLRIRSSTVSNPEEFRFDDGTRDGQQVLAFSRDLVQLVDQVHRELREVM